MDSENREICRTVCAKLPAETATALEQIAEYRGVTRSYLIRELAEAAAEGRVIFKPPPSGRRRAMSIADLGASEVGSAARQLARDEAAAACDADRVAADVAAAPPDAVAIAQRAARLIAEGK